MPRSTSYTPGLLTWPETPISLGPNDGGPPMDDVQPIDAHHLAPCSMIGPTAARVSTLLTIVGRPNNPLTAGKGGFTRGQPRLPSMHSSKPVSSPQMYAPADRCR